MEGVIITNFSKRHKYLPAYIGGYDPLGNSIVSRLVLHISGSSRLALLYAKMHDPCLVLECNIDNAGYWYIVNIISGFSDTLFQQGDHVFRNTSLTEYITDDDVTAPPLCSPVFNDDNCYGGFYGFRYFDSEIANGYYINNFSDISACGTTIKSMIVASSYNLGGGLEYNYRKTICIKFINVYNVDGYCTPFVLWYKTRIRLDMIYDNSSIPFVNVRELQRLGDVKFTFDDKNARYLEREFRRSNISRTLSISLEDVCKMYSDLSIFAEEISNGDSAPASIARIMRMIIFEVNSLFSSMCFHYELDDFIVIVWNLSYNRRYMNFVRNKKMFDTSSYFNLKTLLAIKPRY